MRKYPLHCYTGYDHKSNFSLPSFSVKYKRSESVCSHMVSSVRSHICNSALNMTSIQYVEEHHLSKILIHRHTQNISQILSTSLNIHGLFQKVGIFNFNSIFFFSVDFLAHTVCLCLPISKSKSQFDLHFDVTLFSSRIFSLYDIRLDSVSLNYSKLVPNMSELTVCPRSTISMNSDL